MDVSTGGAILYNMQLRALHQRCRAQLVNCDMCSGSSAGMEKMSSTYYKFAHETPLRIPSARDRHPGSAEEAALIAP